MLIEDMLGLGTALSLIMPRLLSLAPPLDIVVYMMVLILCVNSYVVMYMRGKRIEALWILALGAVIFVLLKGFDYVIASLCCFVTCLVLYVALETDPSSLEWIDVRLYALASSIAILMDLMLGIDLVCYVVAVPMLEYLIIARRRDRECSALNLVASIALASAISFVVVPISYAVLSIFMCVSKIVIIRKKVEISKYFLPMDVVLRNVLAVVNVWS